MAARGQSLLFRLTRFAHKSPRCFAVPIAAKVTESARLAARFILRCSRFAGCVERRANAPLALRTVRATTPLGSRNAPLLDAG